MVLSAAVTQIPLNWHAATGQTRSDIIQRLVLKLNACLDDEPESLHEGPADCPCRSSHAHRVPDHDCLARQASK